ncbi:unnamed protein product [Spirodela intermedia]|uniref:Uncharacterized protein n=2 Tax=Spirodela intermedia TaxID=51605 RepID=A0A7I8IEU4_SPIIN|nr:unnamed protein product [Spirodela intermedia]CAA6656141.1 unnamed protein product [Spirodela intermedia]CAA7391604.1 unnamed protein product [Spirodela intermedia]
MAQLRFARQRAIVFVTFVASIGQEERKRHRRRRLTCFVEKHRRPARRQQKAGHRQSTVAGAGAAAAKTMMLHLVVAAKMKLLAGVGHGPCAGQLLVVLLGPFVLKLSMSRYAPGGMRDLVLSSRLFLFRLGRILSREQPGAGRWERALRLVSDRLDEARRLEESSPDEPSLHLVAMLAL